jgi:hypothetical protein
MTTEGMIIMIASVTVVTVLFAWCIYKVTRSSADAASKLHSIADDTPDRDETGGTFSR